MYNKNLININGKIGSGKDTVGKIIQCLTYSPNVNVTVLSEDLLLQTGDYIAGQSKYKIKKFAAKLKQTASLLTGIPIEKWEDQEFKKSWMGKEWSKWKLKMHSSTYGKEIVKYFNTEEKANRYRAFDSTGGNFLLLKELITHRQFLQWLGTDAMRNGLHKDVWVNALFSEYVDKSSWIITDMRFPNEFKAVKDRNGINIRVKRDNGLETLKTAHISEIALDNHTFDYELDNNGSIVDLIEDVKEMLLYFKIIK